MTSPSLKDRAKTLAGRARKITAASITEVSDQQLGLALEKLTFQVAELASLRLTMEVARAEGIPVPPDPDWTEGLSRYTEQIQGGRPTAPAINGVVRTASRVSGKAREQLADAWSAWAAERVAGLPSSHISALRPSDQIIARRQVTDLSTWSKSAPTATAIRQFANTLELLVETLGDVSISDDLQSALGKANTSSGSPLSSFTDDELAALRNDASIAVQIILRRR
jgi:hypothetical protein